MKLNKAVFLDRDGVINHDPDDYTYKLEETTILPGIIPFTQELIKRGYLIIVITNQGGINKGIYGFEEVEAIHSYLHDEFLKEGVEITDYYYCPHHINFQKCLCRKPFSLMIEKAMHKYDVDPTKSYFIGDKWRDVECGEAAGVKGIKIDVNIISPELINEIA